MLVMMAANLLNIILDPVLIFGWLTCRRWGCWARPGPPPLANALALAVLLFILFRRRELAVTTLLVPFNASILANILRIGMPACLQSAARSSTGTVMFWLVMSGYGEAAAAAFGAGQRIIGLIFVFLSGLSVAATTLTGQVLGSGDKSLARLWLRRLILLGIAVQAVIGALDFALAVPVNAFFPGRRPCGHGGGRRLCPDLQHRSDPGCQRRRPGRDFQGGWYTMPTFWAGFIANWLVKLPVAAVGSRLLRLPVDIIWWAIALSVAVEWLISFHMATPGRMAGDGNPGNSLVPLAILPAVV